MSGGERSETATEDPRPDWSHRKTSGEKDHDFFLNKRPEIRLEVRRIIMIICLKICLGGGVTMRFRLRPDIRLELSG